MAKTGWIAVIYDQNISEAKVWSKRLLFGAYSNRIKAIVKFQLITNPERRVKFCEAVFETKEQALAVAYACQWAGSICGARRRRAVPNVPTFDPEEVRGDPIYRIESLYSREKDR
jgi:hypothetical protein